MPCRAIAENDVKPTAEGCCIKIISYTVVLNLTQSTDKAKKIQYELAISTESH